MDRIITGLDREPREPVVDMIPDKVQKRILVVDDQDLSMGRPQRASERTNCSAVLPFLPPLPMPTEGPSGAVLRSPEMPLSRA